jgi:ribosomal protein L9
MSKIQQFDAGNVGLRPTDTGVDAVAKTAQRVGMFYNQRASAEETLARETDRLGSLTKQLGGETSELGSQVGREMTSTGQRIGGAIADAGAAAVKVEDHREISQGNAAWTTMLQQATDNWNKISSTADPNDPTVATKFMSSLNDQLANFTEQGFYTEEGQKFAEAHANALRQHMLDKTAGDMSNLAGQAIVVNQQKTINSLSNTVHSDPSSIDFALAALKSSTEGLLSSSPNISGVQAGAARSEILQKGAESIVKSAAIGYINKTAQIPPWATDPKYAPYINGAELQMFEKNAQAQAKQNALTEKQTQETNLKLAAQKVRTDSNKVIADNVKFDSQTGQPIIDPKFHQQALDIVRNNPDAPNAGEVFRTMASWGESQLVKGAKPVDDPEVLKDLTDRMFSADKPTTTLDLMKARADGKISDHTFMVRKELVEQLEQAPLKGLVWQNTISAVKDRLIMSGGLLEKKDSVGSANYAAFISDFIPRYQSMSRAGTLPPNALDLKDPKSMISQSLEPYKRSLTDRMMDAVERNGGIGSSATPGALATTPAPPPSLGNIPDLRYHPETKQFSDPTSGAVYDSAGKMQIPATKDRVGNAVYPTPKGRMTWTGTGWAAESVPALPASR